MDSNSKKNIKEFVEIFNKLNKSKTKILNDMTEFFLDYLDPKRSKKLRKKYGIIASYNISKYLKKQDDRLYRWLEENIDYINNRNQFFIDENVKKYIDDYYIKNYEDRLTLSYFNSDYVYRNIQFILNEKEKFNRIFNEIKNIIFLLKENKIINERKLIAIIDMDSKKFEKLEHELDLISKELENLKLKIEEYVIYITYYQYKNRFYYKINLKEISNLKGYINLNIIFKDIRFKELKDTFKQVYEENPQNFFDYVVNIIYSAVKYTISNNEKIFREIYSNYFNINMNIYLVMFGGISYFKKDEKDYQNLKIYINLSFLHDDIHILSSTLIHELSHIFDKKIGLSRNILENFRAEGLAIFSEFIYSNVSPPLGEYSINLPLDNVKELDIAAKGKESYSLGFLVLMIIFYNKIRSFLKKYPTNFIYDLSSEPLGIINEYQYCIYKYPEIANELKKKARLFIREMRQINIKKFFRDYFKTAEELNIKPLFDPKFVSDILKK